MWGRGWVFLFCFASVTALCLCRAVWLCIYDASPCIGTWWCMYVDANVVCMHMAGCVCVCVWGGVWRGVGGVPLPCYSQTICKAGCWSRVEVRGTAGAPLWLINVVAGTPSPPEWRQRPHNAQPVCYACLSLSVDYVVRPWSSAGGVTVPGGRSGPKLITIIWQNACSATVI